MSATTRHEAKQDRRNWNQVEAKWDFAVVDAFAVLTKSVGAGIYWLKLKIGQKKEGNQAATDCHGLKMFAADGKQRPTAVADTKQLHNIH